MNVSEPTSTVIAPYIPPSDQLREQLDVAETEAALLRAQLRLALCRDREQEPHRP